MISHALRTPLAAASVAVLAAGVAFTAGAEAQQAAPEVVWEQTGVTPFPPTRAVKWSPVDDLLAVGSGRLSVSAGHQAELAFWTVADSEKIKSVTQPDGVRIARLNALAFHPDGQSIVTAEGQGPTSTWAISGRSAEFTVPGGDRLQFYPVQPSAMLEIAVSPDGALIARGQWDDDNLQIVDFETGAVTHDWVAHQGGVIGVAFSPDGEFVATGGSDAFVRVWRLSDGEMVHEFEPAFDVISIARVNSVAFSPDGSMIGAGYEGYVVGSAVWSLADGELLHTDDGNYYQIPRVMFTHDSEHLIIASRAWDQGEPWVGHIRFLDVTTGEVPVAWRFDQGSPNNGVTDLDLSPDGEFIAFVQWDGVLTVAENPVFETGFDPDPDPNPDRNTSRGEREDRP